MTSKAHRVPDRDPEGGPDSPPNPPTRPDPTRPSSWAEVVCGSLPNPESENGSVCNVRGRDVRIRR